MPTAAGEVGLAERSVLALDPDLGRGIAAEEWDACLRACRGELLAPAAGPWAADELAGRNDVAALLVLDGLLCREISLRDRCMLEFVGSEDVLLPPLGGDPPHTGTHPQLTILGGVRLLVLGGAFIAAAARWPVLLARVQQRLEVQRERLAIQGLIAHLPRAEHRLLLMLWHLAARWGHVTREGTLLSLRLSHDVLALMIGARRPTVTLAVRVLEADGLVRRLDDGTWCLPPAAERAVNALHGGCEPRMVGERLMVWQQAGAARDAARAVVAEARQLRSAAADAAAGIARPPRRDR